MIARPPAYRHASPCSDVHAVLSIARRLWDALPERQRDVLQSVDPAGWILRGRKADRARLAALGYAQSTEVGGSRITKVGALVLEAGRAAGGAS